MSSRRITLIAAAVGLALTACGSSDEQSAPNESDAAPDAVAAPADAQDTVDSPAESADPTAASSPDATEPTAAGPDAADDDPPAAGSAPETDVVTSETPIASEPPTPEVGGRALATEVDPAARFDGNPFPDLVVADVGRSGEANLANLLPSDRPLLLWAWAPH